MAVVSALRQAASMLELPDSQRFCAQYMRLDVRLLDIAARAGFRSLCKGANKRRRIAVFRPPPGPGAAGPTATAHGFLIRGQCVRGTPRGWAERPKRDL